MYAEKKLNVNIEGLHHRNGIKLNYGNETLTVANAFAAPIEGE